MTVAQGLVLAAGRGTRLGSLSSVLAKALAPVGAKPVMQYQLEALREHGVLDVAVVIGPTSGAVRRHFGDGGQLGMRLSYIEDPAPAGIAASLLCAEGWVRGPFAVFLADIMLALGPLERAFVPMEHGAAGVIVVRRDEADAVRRNFAVLTDGSDRVRRVIEKPADPPTDLKGVGAYVFDTTIFDAIRRTPRSKLRNEYEITDSIQTLIDMGRPVYASEVVRWDVNITYPGDLIDCNLRVLRELGVERIVGGGADVGMDVQLHASVVGDRAVVRGPVRLEECLVLPDARVDQFSGTVRRHIFGPGVVWSAS